MAQLRRRPHTGPRRFDPETPLEETIGALASAVQQGKAPLYRRHFLVPPGAHRRSGRILRGTGVPALIHQPSCSMINRWIENEGLLDVLEEGGLGCLGFVPLARPALNWVLRDEHVASVLTGASSVTQFEANAAALNGPQLPPMSRPR